MERHRSARVALFAAGLLLACVAPRAQPASASLADALGRDSAHYVPNVLNSNYADVAWMAPLDEDFKLRLGAQAMVQKGVGEQLLTGTSFSPWSAGLKGDLMTGGTTWSMAGTPSTPRRAWRNRTGPNTT